MTGPRTTDADRAIGQRIRRVRQALGLTQTQVAERIGVTYQQLAKYESGLNRISAGRLGVLATALALAPEDLLAPPEGIEVSPALRMPRHAQELISCLSRCTSADRQVLIEVARALAGKAR